MKFITFECDKCHKSVRQAKDVLPKSWVVAQFSSLAMGPRSYHWCDECYINATTTVSTGPTVARRIRSNERSSLLPLIEVEEDMVDEPQDDEDDGDRL